MPLDAKYIFFGTPEFAAVVLDKLIGAGFVPEAVVCGPDRPVGRKKIITPPPVKTRIMNYEARIKEQIKIFQPENLSVIHDSLSGLQPDLFIVAAYAKIIPADILEITRLGAVGIHPSLLPKHRGPSPIQSALLGGDSETGVTLFLIDEKVDHGKIISSLKSQISETDNYEILMRKLAELSANLLVETLPNVEEKIKNAKPQDESLATYTKKFKTEDGFVNLNKDDPVLIERKIRALSSEPGVFTVIGNKRVKILEAKVISGKLAITKIQMEGKKPTADRKFIETLLRVS